MDVSSFIEVYTNFSANAWLRAGTVVLVYGLLAKAADLFIDRILRRLTEKTSFRFDDYLIGFLHSPICWTIFFLGVLHALVIPPLPAPWQTALPALAKTAILLFWLIALIRTFSRLADDQLARNLAQGKIGTDLFLLIKNLARVVLLVLAFLWLLAIWDIDMTPLFASAGIAGIAVALAAKDTLANFFGGLSIFMDKTFKVGDYIVLDSDERGEVVEIGIRSTRIKTRDDVIVTIPNSILANSKIINESAPIPRFRIRVPVGVAYGSDLDHVERVLLGVAAANPEVAREPEARVRLRVLNSSSVDFELLCWADDPSLKGKVRHDLLRHIHDTFMREGITIPFPQQDVHLFQANQRTPPGS